MRSSRRWKRTLAGVMAVGLVIAACGDDDGDSDSGSTEAPGVSDAVEEAETAATDAMEEAETAATDAEEEAETAATDAMEEEETAATDAEEEASGEPLATEGEVEVAAGTTLNLDECPDDWSATTGVDGDEIRVGISLPQSGPAAFFGPIAGGIEYYFDYTNDNDPVDGKQLVLIARDDGYESGRTVANVQEMLDTEDIFSLMYVIGTANNQAVRPITDEACVPQLFNATGGPEWGDPANFPWTVGGLLNYETEADIWCQDIVENYGEGATVAALLVNNDFGKIYESSLQECESNGQIEIVEMQLHDQAAPSVSNELTTLIASGADVFIAGTLGGPCPESVGTVAQSEWRPAFYMSYVCNNLAAFFEPVKDAADALAQQGSAVRMVNTNKICGDPAYADDPWIMQVEEILSEYGSVTCADGSYSTGVLFGEFIVDVIRDAAALPGGLNRVNLMSAMWNWDSASDGLIGGTLKLDGVNDAYASEAAQMQEIVVTDGSLTFVPLGDVVDLEGQGGSYEGG